MDLREVTPWTKNLLKDVAAGLKPFALPLRKGFPSGTPNSEYISYNVIMPVSDLLKACPGTLYFRVPDALGRERVAQMSSEPLKPYLVNRPSDNPEKLLERMRAAPRYAAKDWFSAAENENIIQWFESKSLFKGVAKAKADRLMPRRVTCATC